MGNIQRIYFQTMNLLCWIETIAELGMLDRPENVQINHLARIGTKETKYNSSFHETLSPNVAGTIHMSWYMFVNS